MAVGHWMLDDLLRVIGEMHRGEKVDKAKARHDVVLECIIRTFLWLYQRFA